MKKIFLFIRNFKVMKNGVYFIIIAFLVAEPFKILIYATYTFIVLVMPHCGHKMM